VLAVRDSNAWRYVGHVGTGFSHAMLEELYARMLPLQTLSTPSKQRIKDEAATHLDQTQARRRGEVH
jgi:bifunctional non-homologous end joining protein LigD